MEKIYLQNEIFEDLKKEIKDLRHVAFAYSYFTYVSFLYRYCGYVDGNGSIITQEKIKEFLGYSPINKRVNFIVKKNGVLDKMGYTITTTDYPILWSLDEDNDVEFTTIKELKSDLPKSIVNDRNFKVKKPLTGFHRHNHNELDGTFYFIENTHEILFPIFESIVKEIGLIGFYIYGYLKSRCTAKGYQISIERLSEELHMDKKTLKSYLNELEQKEYINITHSVFKVGAKAEEKKPNIYYAS